MSEPTTQPQTGRALARARAFASNQSGELVTVEPAAIDQAPPDDYQREGIATLDDVEGRHPSLAIKTSLKEQVGAVVTVVDIDFTPTPAQFLAEKRAKGLDPEEVTAVLTFVGPDQRYYVAVSGNGRMMRSAQTLKNLLRRVEGVRCRVVAYQSAGGVGYALGPVGGDPT